MKKMYHVQQTTACGFTKGLVILGGSRSGQVDRHRHRDDGI
jgi:hypothetical protein